MFSSFKMKVLVSFLLLIGILAIPIKTHAQTPASGFNLQISPLPIDLSLPPGTSTTAPLRVRNAGFQTEKLQVRLLKVTEDDNGGVHLTEPAPSDEFVHWVSFSKTVFNAPPNEWQDITMTINVPKSAAFGYYFAVEYLRAADVKPQGGQTAAHGAVATFVLLNAEAPGATRSAQVVSFKADRKSYEFLPATFTAKIRSTGNVHVAPHGNVFIKRGSKQVGAVGINTALGNILPHSSRLFDATWGDGFPAYVTVTNNGNVVVGKNGKPKQSLKWDLSHANRLRFGKYTAHLVMVYNDGQRDVPLEANVSFWVVPWRLMFYALVILVLPALLVYILMRWRFNKRLEKERKKADRHV
jgi:hypothetical protein